MMKQHTISNIIKAESGEVWDITFRNNEGFYEDEPNFIAQNIVVHNCHAAGIVISPVPLAEICPLHMTHGAAGSKEKQVATQFTMSEVESLGLIKFDVLGLATKSALRLALKLIKDRYDVKVDLANLPLDDPKTLELLNSGKTDGCFQLENTGMKQTLNTIGIDNFDDLIVAIAMYRPGPKDYIPEFANRKRGVHQVSYPHPIMEKITKKTFGIMCYQEQVMQTFMAMADLTATAGYKFMKGCAKKKPELIADAKEKFVRGAQSNGVSIPVIEKIWKDMEKFGGYAFNKSLSLDQKIITSEKEYSIQELYNRKCKGKTFPYVYSSTGKPIKIVDVYDHGVLPVWEVEFADGSRHKSTLNHKFMTPQGALSLSEILRRNLSVIKHRGVGNAKEERLGLSGLPSSGKKSRGVQQTQKKVRPVSDVQEGFRVSSLWTQRHSTRHRVTQETLSPVEGNEVPKLLKIESENLSTVLGRYQNKPRSLQQIQGENVGSSIFGHPFESRGTRSPIKVDEQSQCDLSRCVSEKQSAYSYQDICQARNTRSPSRTSQKVERRESRGVFGEVYPSCYAAEPMAICTREASKGHACSSGVPSLSNHQEQNVHFCLQTTPGGFYRQRQESGCGIRRSISLPKSHEQQVSTEQPAKGQRSQQTSLSPGLFGCSNIVRHLVVSSPKVQIPAIATGDDSCFVLPRERSGQNDWQEIRIAKVRYVGFEQCYDLEVNSFDHLYCLASGIINSNSHACSYAYESFKTAYLKAHYPTEFIAARLSVETRRRNFDDVQKYESDAKKNYGIQIHPPDLNRSKSHYTIVGERELLRSLICKGIGDKAVEDIVAYQPYQGKDRLYTFATKVGSAVNTKVVEAMVDAGLWGKVKKSKVLKDFEQIKQDLKRNKGRPMGDLFG